jgi:hypothetical protein
VLASLYDIPLKTEGDEWLHDVLADGPQPAATVKRWAKAAEFPEPTFHRARRKAGVEVTRSTNEKGRPSLWALKGYVSPVSCQTAMKRNPQAPDQGQHGESGDYVSASGVDTKPPVIDPGAW